ncbi:MAG: hypothetical protein WAU01_10780, partial [Saprospiraceae bacterium]
MRRLSKEVFLLFIFVCTSIFAQSQADKVVVSNNGQGQKLLVNGKDFMVNGMNWDYFPIGTNYTYSLWTQSDATIVAALDSEMS